MSRSYLMRRPRESDEEDSDQEIVHAKPINERYARNLGNTFQGKDFVRGSAKSQQQFYGAQTVEDGSSGSTRPLTADERNKLSAKILKAEMKGNKELVSKLKRQLESGVTDDEPSTSSSKSTKDVVLMTTDKRTGQAVPARKPTEKGYAEERTRGTVDNEYRRVRDLRDMVAEEKSTTAEDQLTMFNRAAKMCSDNKVDDDWNVDDSIMSHPKKRRHGEKDEKKSSQKRVKEHKELERTLDSCKLCIDSKRIEKQTIVVTGLKTYLAVVPWDGLSEDHCMIIPMAHYSNSVTLDEDVYDEMRLWRKGLVAMWNSEDQDCVFVEMVRDPAGQKHMTIECIPLPREVGDTAPIYFKKAIMESESEWSDNKKLIDLSKFRNGDIRKAIPKGFPYFAIDFGLQAGYAHVIEDTNAYPANFAHEIIGGMLDLHHRHWRNQQSMAFEEVKKKRDAFRDKWKPFDWTAIAKEATKTSEGPGDS